MLSYNQSNMFKYFLALSVLFLTYFTVYYKSNDSMFFNKLENEINFINDFPEIKPEKCLTSNPFIDGLQTFICLKPLDDWVSLNIDKYGAWEQDIVNNVIRAMNAYPSAVFVDVGANIGMYTLVIAALKRSVIAVDADSINLAYIRQSLEISKTRNNVDLIYNSISNEYNTLYPYTPNDNALISMFTKEEITAENLVTAIPPLKSIKLKDIINYAKSDIIIIKIDIEGYECKALQPDVLLNKLGKFVPYIFMEWNHIFHNTYGKCPFSEFSELAQLFYDGDYLPFNPGTMEQIADTERDQAIDIVWVHSSAIRLKVKKPSQKKPVI